MSRTAEIQQLIEELGHCRHAQLQLTLLSQLVEIGEDAVFPLLEAMHDDNWQVQSFSIRALERIGDPRAIEPMLKAFATHPRKLAIAKALVSMGDDRAVEPLINDFLQHPNFQYAYHIVKFGEQVVMPLVSAFPKLQTEAKIPVAFALSMLYIREKQAVETLSEWLEENNWELRFYVALAIRNSDPTHLKAFDTIQSLLAPETWHVTRRLTAQRLGDHGIAWATELLYQSLINDENTSVVSYAARGLGHIGSEEAGSLLTIALAHERKAVRVYARNNLRWIDMQNQAKRKKLQRQTKSNISDDQ